MQNLDEIDSFSRIDPVMLTSVLKIQGLPHA